METTKERAKRIRVELKERYPDCKFSVVTGYASLMSEITVSLMSAPRKPYTGSEHWSDGQAQLNEYVLVRNKWDDDNGLCNGVHLERWAWDMLSAIANSYGCFGSRHTFFHLQIGKWNKHFEVKA